MTLTKANLIDLVYNESDFLKLRAAHVVESLLEIIKRTLETSEDLLISGFGKFSVKDKEERKGRNPATGDGMILRARRVVTFKFSDGLRERVDGKG